jgi:beta-hydroxylase
MKYGFMTAINRWVSHHIVKASATQNVDGENVGVLNKVFGWIYEVHLAGQRVKKWNRKLYYTLKYSVTALILGLLVASALR